MTLDKAIEKYFEVAVGLRGMAAGTVEAYRADFRDFLRFASSLGLREVADVTTAHVNEYLLGLRRRGLKLATLHRRRNALSSLFRFAEEQGWVGRNPVSAARLQPRPRAGREVVLSGEEVRAFLRADVSYRTVAAEVVDALRLLLVFTGLRCSELLKLDWTHIDLDARLLTVYDSKNSNRKGLPRNKDRDRRLTPPAPAGTTA
ncbi:MAG: site-specific integrase [Clostridia bacterium]|nr:site-specific integrase [Clostridia bacterium]MDH7572542.1 site-specific integrase [Clostridia bacterium]